MPVKMILTAVVGRPHERFSHVVIQPREPQDRILRQCRDDAHGVLPYVEEVIGRALGAPEGAGNLRQADGEDACISAEHPRGGFAREQFHEFLAYPLPGDAREQIPLVLGGGGGIRLHGKAEDGGKAQGAQDAQGILLETAGWVTDGADDTRVNIRPAAEWVHVADPGGVGNGVHGEIAPCKVFTQ